MLLYRASEPTSSGISYAYLTPAGEEWKMEWTAARNRVTLANCNWRNIGSSTHPVDPDDSLAVALASMQNRPEDLTLVNGQVCDIPGATQVRLVWPSPFDDETETRYEQLSEDGRFLSVREWFIGADHIEVLDADGNVIGLSEGQSKGFERVP
ncbi:MAG: hypothetical protein IIC27_05455 [Chloroflexi bacterium]|nr:hypothetical protein [Chloroflexota bacterium]